MTVVNKRMPGCDICAADQHMLFPRAHATRTCTTCQQTLDRHCWAVHPHYLIRHADLCSAFTEVLDEAFEA